MKIAINIGVPMGDGLAPDGLTCPAAIPLSSGVAASVSVPTGDRWYRFVVAETGVLSTAFTLTGGTGTVTGYKNGSCDSLPASSFSASATAFPTTNVSVTAGDVVRIKVSQSTGTMTGSLTLTAIDPATLPGAVAYWPNDEGAGLVARNAWSGSAPATDNLLMAPENLFASYWTKTGAAITPTDNYAANPDGIISASRLQWTASNSLYEHALSRGAAQYTLSIWIKSNTGSSQTFRLGTQGSYNGTSSDLTATTTWQQISWTFTASATFTSVYIRTAATPAAGDFVVWGAKLELGASATAYTAPDGHFRWAAVSGPTWSNGGLTTSTASTKVYATFTTPQTVSEGTIYQCFKIPTTAVASLPLYSWFLSALPGTATWSLYGPGTNDNTFNLGGRFGSATAATTNGNNVADGNWHVLSLVVAGSVMSIYLDGVLISSVAYTATSFTLYAMRMSYDTENYSVTGTRGPTAMYSAGHTAAQVRQMTVWLQGQMTARSLSFLTPPAFVVFEGDSITAQSNATNRLKSYAGLSGSAITATRSCANLAVSGSTIATLTARATALDAYLTQRPANGKAVLHVFIGTNDITNSGRTGAQVFADLKTYCTARLTAGWDKIVVGTMLPRTVGGGGQATFDAQRAIFNAAVTGETLGVYWHGVSDFAAEATMGPDGANLNATYYAADGVHPTDAGHALLAPVATAALDAV